ncbi:hypothetical protein THAOC_19340 [Thalassiosira oceanica]|uniref:Uncharacterized protein n=1 Tax=Thalassiosira oceanica TaxID=159749 RepID=K0SH55_THAOC|nr:hypothetical protein THAOC_19340 [Thalassiosira oceanica]|eukprot:EJK60326.1 hypothetical protein THAOC_19340 [Thalassiosira oceanica]
MKSTEGAAIAESPGRGGESPVSDPRVRVATSAAAATRIAYVFGTGHKGDAAKTTPAPNALRAKKFLAASRGGGRGPSRLEELGREFLELITKTHESGAYAADYSPIMREYARRVREIEEEGDKEG